MTLENGPTRPDVGEQGPMRHGLVDVKHLSAPNSHLVVVLVVGDRTMGTAHILHMIEHSMILKGTHLGILMCAELLDTAQVISLF
jgi:hypothetical protein